MVFVPSWLRPGATMMLLPLLALGCHKGSSEDIAGTIAINGTVTYARIPVKVAADGTPLGLETDSTKFLPLQPAREVVVRLFEGKDEVMPDGTKVRVWSQPSPSITGNTGTYSFRVAKDTPCFLQLESSFKTIGTATGVRLVADPKGVSSSLPIGDRLQYVIRKGLDGTLGTVAAPLPAVNAATDVKVDFTVGLDDPWMTVVPDWFKPQPVTLPKETVAVGSRVLAILDDCYKWMEKYGDCTPGGPLALHYRPGVSEDRGSFVEFDRNTYPLSFLDSTHYFFGSIRGGSVRTDGTVDPTLDDAWYQGVTIPLLARNSLMYTTAGIVGQRPTGARSTSLSPDVAMLDGFGDAMSAILLKTPYMAQAGPGGAAAWRDIRKVDGLAPAEVSPYSAPALASLAWQMNLRAHAITAPGTPDDWAKFDTEYFKRFFGIIRIEDSTTTYSTDIPNLFVQLERLHEAKTDGAAIDLNALFPDAVLTSLLAPYNVPWPRPSTGEYASYMVDWGTDPSSLKVALPDLVFDMTNAVRVPTFDGTRTRDLFPDAGAGQVRFARFMLDKDILYRMSVTANPPLPADATVELFMDSYRSFQTVLFPGSDPAASHMISLEGDASSTSYQYHNFRFRLKSPDFRVPRTQLTFHLEQVATRTAP